MGKKGGRGQVGFRAWVRTIGLVLLWCMGLIGKRVAEVMQKSSSTPYPHASYYTVNIVMLVRRILMIIVLVIHRLATVSTNPQTV